MIKLKLKRLYHQSKRHRLIHITIINKLASSEIQMHMALIDKNRKELTSQISPGHFIHN